MVSAPAAPPALCRPYDFPSDVEAERVSPIGPGCRPATALTFNVSCWKGGTENLPGRTHRCSTAGDLLRPQDLLETSICPSRGTGGREDNLTPEHVPREGSDRIMTERNTLPGHCSYICYILTKTQQTKPIKSSSELKNRNTRSNTAPGRYLAG